MCQFTPILAALLLCLAGCSVSVSTENDNQADSGLKEAVPVLPVLVIHGGAGYLTPESLSEEQKDAYQASLRQTIDFGYAMLEEGRPALEVVEEVIRRMEDDSLFNAGRGAVVNAQGQVEMDASIMDGASGAAGAVAGVQLVKNPISLARLVKDSTGHVLLSGAGAAGFAEQMRVEKRPMDYFITHKRAKQYKERIARQDKHGTVGAAALDLNGNLAAGTSTGGMMMKQYGRIGDSPIIGAGTYANNNTCAVSCTGHGEFFIRNAVAYDLSARLEYTDATLEEATSAILHDKLLNIKGMGGLIAVDKHGNVCADFNTPGMFRAWQRKGEASVVRIFAEQEE